MNPRLPLAATYVLAVFAAIFSGVFWLVLIGWVAIIAGACIVADHQVSRRQGHTYTSALQYRRGGDQ